MDYSVLIAVYYKDNDEYFRQALNSIINQTVKTDDIVVVCDGPLGKKLDNVLSEYSDYLNIIRLKKNFGLGIALNEGIKQCKYELIVRMDSDDLSKNDRCEYQIKMFENNPKLDIVSAAISEFIDNPKNTVGIKSVPETQQEIIEFSKKRCPFNHPVVMFRKSAVISAGGYTESYHKFEDYDLWIRMLRNGAVGGNTRKILLYMRVDDDTYRRRGGKEYAKDLIRFHNHLRKTNWITMKTFLTCAVPHAVVCILPNNMRKAVYKVLRKK